MPSILTQRLSALPHRASMDSEASVSSPALGPAKVPGAPASLGRPHQSPRRPAPSAAPARRAPPAPRRPRLLARRVALIAAAALAAHFVLALLAGGGVPPTLLTLLPEAALWRLLSGGGVGGGNASGVPPPVPAFAAGARRSGAVSDSAEGDADGSERPLSAGLQGAMGSRPNLANRALAGEAAAVAAATASGARSHGAGSGAEGAGAGAGGVAASTELKHAAAALARAAAEGAPERRAPVGFWGRVAWALGDAAPAWLDGVAEAAHARLLARWEAAALVELAAAEANNERESQGEGREGRSDALVWESADSGANAARDAVGPPSGDACARLLHVPKVALMFLTRGVLHHEAAWALWFAAARGLVPAAAVRARGCAPPQLAALRGACGAAAGPRLLQQQHLFSVYVHVGANDAEFAGFPADSLFHGTDIAERVHVRWGTFALVDATRALLRAALADRANARFVLLSESGIPLYPPAALHQQLTAERRSRINACAVPGDERNLHRWLGKMESDKLKREHWRKSSQWMVLTRAHAALAANETEVAERFRQYCLPTFREGWWRDCYSDEHYFATLLAAEGRDAETDCWGYAVHVDWSRMGEHPRAYEPREITSSRLRQLRGPTEGCRYPAAIASAAAQLVPVDAVCDGAPPPPYAAWALGPQCPLFARKFGPHTAPAVFAAFADCANGLRIASDGC